jgi:hypothetical protein
MGGKVNSAGINPAATAFPQDPQEANLTAKIEVPSVSIRGFRIAAIENPGNEQLFTRF